MDDDFWPLTMCETTLTTFRCSLVSVRPGGVVQVPLGVPVAAGPGVHLWPRTRRSPGPRGRADLPGTELRTKYKRLIVDGLCSLMECRKGHLRKVIQSGCKSIDAFTLSSFLALELLLKQHFSIIS